jgi:protein phosphatase methylesterase 1
MMAYARRYQLVGHSMGGSVTVQSCPKLLERGYKITGVAVLDVVEGALTILAIGVT